MRYAIACFVLTYAVLYKTFNNYLENEKDNARKQTDKRCSELYGKDYEDWKQRH